MRPTRLKTHAKLNLYLRVVGLRSDGYHEIETILHGIDFGDEITLMPNDSAKVTVDLRLAEGVAGEVPVPEANVVHSASRVLLERGAAMTGLEVGIVKHIPIGAGLGGGSGNASGVLVALNEMWEMALGRADLHELAATIGMDVPYCLDGGTALATARGEKLTRLPAPDEMWFVLGISRMGLLTKDVYRAFDEVGGVAGEGPSEMTLALGAGHIEEIGSLLHNDLEQAAFHLRPELAHKKKVLLDAGAVGAAMTGSGPTLFALARDEVHAKSIAVAAEDEFDFVRVTTSRSECIEMLD